MDLNLYEQQCEAVMNQRLYVSTMLYNADVAAVLPVSCCDLHAVLCQSFCNAVGLSGVEQQCDAVMNQCLCLSNATQC